LGSSLCDLYATANPLNQDTSQSFPFQFCLYNLLLHKPQFHSP